MPTIKASYKPKNKLISDIFYQHIANIPLSLPYDLRGDFEQEWRALEKRIKTYYKEKD